METLLYIVHRIPYPPNKGDKIRSYNILKYLSGKYKIYLAAFIDDGNDWQYIEYLSSLCKDSFFVKINTQQKKLLSLRGLLTGEALSVVYYRDKHFKQWVDKTIKQNSIDKILAFSSPMAQYIDEQTMKTQIKLMDLVDVDSDKWLQYANAKKFPASWIYRREAEKLFQYEQKIISLFDKTTLVSEEEAGLLKSLVPSHENKISFFSNGVDTEYFKPEDDYLTPYKTDKIIIVFTGAMDYWANVDAVIWFVEYVFPVVRENINTAQFYIVGSNPAPEVRALEKIPGVRVTGSVTDIRPYIYFSNLVVAPLRIARGIQNKVLEAMSLAKPVLATSAAVEGINATPEKHLFVADSDLAFQARTIELLKNQKISNVVARKLVVDNYSWKSKLEKLDYMLQGNDCQVTTE